jgi:hypothetical protein
VIKIDEVETYGWQAAIRGMRNPKNSWDKSDTTQCCGCDKDCASFNNKLCVGNADLKLMETLGVAGTDHGKYLRMITVTADITAPLYWWKEYDTYKVGTVANSCSTMHKIQAKEFVLSDFSTEHLSATNLIVFSMVIDAMNNARLDFLQRKDKKDWWQMIQMLPTCYNQKRTVQLNYAVLKNMYHSRQNHKLDEWREFCKWVETLPYSQLITG